MNKKTTGRFLMSLALDIPLMVVLFLVLYELVGDPVVMFAGFLCASIGIAATVIYIVCNFIMPDKRC